MTGKSDYQQERYDKLLLSTIEGIDEKTDGLVKEVAKQGIELKNNTKETKILSGRVETTNGNVKELQTRVIEINKVVFPETPVKAKDLDDWYRDPKILSLLKLVGGIILVVLVIYAALKGIPLPGGIGT